MSNGQTPEEAARVQSQRAAMIPRDLRQEMQPPLPAHEPDRSWERADQQSTAESERQRRLIEELHRPGGR